MKRTLVLLLLGLLIFVVITGFDWSTFTDRFKFSNEWSHNKAEYRVKIQGLECLSFNDYEYCPADGIVEFSFKPKAPEEATIEIPFPGEVYLEACETCHDTKDIPDEWLIWRGSHYEHLLENACMVCHNINQ